MKLVRTTLLALPLALLAACGGSSSPTPTGVVNLMISDASAQDWALIGVKILSISLQPQSGGAPVTVYAPSTPPVMNLVQLDQLAEILGNVDVPEGTYTAATLTLAANPGDVLLTVSANPEPGFAGTAGAALDPSHIAIQGATGSAGARTVPVKVKFVSPLVVSAGQSNALDLEFDLSHPAFIVDHVTAAGTVWAVDFDGPVRHRPISAIARLVLRHLYGTVTAVASDKASITITRDFPVHPATNPETFIASPATLQILADATNGTFLYDLDAKTRSTIHDFSSVAATLVGKCVRVAARYQSNGTLVAVRLYVSASFPSVWISPEGHVLHVDTVGNTLTVENEDGAPVTLDVSSATDFFWRTPEKALADATPIGTGTAFLANLVRGFKVHVAVVDPLANPLVAQSVDIEIAHFSGRITSATGTGFTYVRTFANAADDYTKLLTYISASTPNGEDASGNAITGFDWWNLTFPTLADTGASAIPDFVAAAGGSVSFGGTAGTLAVYGDSRAVWNDPARANDWSARWVVLLPAPAPLGSVATAFDSGTSRFGMTVVNGGATPVSVDLSTTSGSATLVYQVDDTSGVVTVSAEDIGNSSTLATVASQLAVGTPVKVFGVPQPDGSIKAYVLLYYTGTLPTR